MNGRDVLGSDVGAIRIGFAKVPVKNGQDGTGAEESIPGPVQGIGNLSVGATIHALRAVKGAITIPADQQVLSGAVENYRSNLLLSMIGSGIHDASFAPDGLAKPPGWVPAVTEQQMIMKELSVGSADAEADIAALAGLWVSICNIISFQSFLQTSDRLPCTIPLFRSCRIGRITDVGMPPSFVTCASDWTQEP